GTFRAPAADGGGRSVLFVDAGDQGVGRSEVVPPSFIGAVSVVVAPLAPFQGRVLDAEGKPLVADVSLSAPELLGMRGKTIRTGGDGASRFGSVGDRRLVVAARARGHDAETRTVQSSESPIELRLGTQRVVGGRVLGRDGKPLPRELEIRIGARAAGIPTS